MISVGGDAIKVDQCLHGYADGHRLLQSSRKFPSETNKTMLLMTDMSGPRMISGFESYLTGYFLNEIGCYALGRTWYASEMDRPGCVWTHTLLVENSDISSIVDLRTLIRLFKRPGKESFTWTAYNAPLYIERSVQIHGNDATRSMINDSTRIMPQLLQALYGLSSSQPVYLPTDDASKFEDLVILVWNQQWSTLRKAFVFSTGSIANRKTSGRQFDLQVISWRSLNQLGREVPSSIVISVDDNSPLKDAPAWVQIAAGDLESDSSGSDFRRFLQDYGVDTAKPRAAFAPLAQVFASSQRSNNDCILNELVNLVAESFPKSGDASRLKESLLGPSMNGFSRIPVATSESDLLWALVTTPFESAFDHDQMNVRHRARELLASSRSEARKITIELVEREITSFGEEFLTGISEAINIDDAYEFAKAKPELLNAFTKYNPQLAAMPGLWRLSADEQREFFDIVLANPHDSADIISNMIGAMLEAQSDVMAQEVVARYKQLAVDTVLDWLDIHPNCLKDLGREWLWALQTTPTLLLQWLRQRVEPNEHLVAFVSGLLDPHNEVVITAGADIWSSVKKRPYSSLNHDSYIRVTAFLLALGFNNPPLGAAELVSRSFDSVHDAAADQSLPKSSWRLLKHQAPDYSSWWSWDKCKRLRCALVERFIRFQWPRQSFLESAKGKTFEKVLNNSYDVTGGRDFIRRVAHESNIGVIQADPDQLKELRYFL
jgi:GTPase-associated protein 1, N-terminal domain type 1